ncbi:MAG TPA: phage tail protein [Thermoanaerobaculia bacterium]|jgi:phage tail-like protein
MSDNFLYLNREGRWPDFEHQALELGADGAMRLASLPLLEPPEELAGLPSPDAPAGIAAGDDGTVWWSGERGLWARDPCDGSAGRVPCLGDGGDGGDLHAVRALLLHPARPALVAADAGRHHLRLYHPDGFQLLDVWGGPGSEPGRFDEPWSLAADPEGNVYVVDRGNRRVQKLDLRGDVVPEFWETARSEVSFERPLAVTVASVDGQVRVYVLDDGRDLARSGKIVALDDRGHVRRVLALPGIEAPLGFLVRAGAIYLGDNARRRLLKLGLDGTLVGEAAGYEGPVAGLAIDPRGDLWLHPGSGAEPRRFAARGAFVRSGALWGGPFGDGQRPRAWHRLQALGSPLEGGAHFRYFLHAANGPDPPPAPDLTAEPELFDETAWQAMAQDVPDVLAGAVTKYLWIGAHLAGEGRESPRLGQMRLDFDHETWARYLPAIYREPSKGADPELLDRFLSLFESFFEDVEGEIGELDRLFDPAAVPAEWLPWLASWLALELDREQPEEKQRRAVAAAFAGYAWRGTARGLRAALRFQTGVDAHVEEPLAQTGWWALPAEDEDPESPAAGVSVLGFTTVLVPAEAQGAALGSTAILDAGDLIRGEDFGAPLFAETAHRFSVSLYRSQVTAPGKLDEVRAVIEREKPAHTAYRICLIEPRLRLGWQARLGIDAVVAGGPGVPTPLGGREPAAGVVLGGEAAPRLGAAPRIGQTIRLGPATTGKNHECPSGKPRSADRR